VLAATEAYFETQDVISDRLDGRTVMGASRDRVSAGRIPRSELKSFAFQFLSEDFLSLLALGLVFAQLDRLPAVDTNNVVVCHCSDAPAWRHFAVKQIALTLEES
jgi:hypothetical protein